MSDQKLKFSAFLTQGIASLTIATSLIISGSLLAWPSCTFENFTSNSTYLSAPMTIIEVSLFGSLPNVGALLTTPFCGYALRKLGRKHSCVLFAVSFVIAWSIISLTTYVSLVLLAMFIGGVGCAGFTTSLVYISEISEESVRGAFTSFNVICYLSGLLLSYILGGYLTYYQVIYVCLSLSIISTVMLTMFKESPVFLLQNGKEEEAAKSIAFYKRLDVKSPKVNVEIIKIKQQFEVNIALLHEDNIDVIDGLLSNKSEEMTSEIQSEWKFLLKSESSKRALTTCVIVMISTLMMGVTVLQVFAEVIFQEAVPSIDSSKCAIYLGLDFIIATVISAFIVDNLGRKNLLTASSAGSGLCTLLLGTQLLLHWAPHLCTVLLIYLFTFVFSLGAGVVPFILPAEVFVPEVRGLCNSIIISSMWFTYSVSLFIYNPLVEALGLGVVFCGFSVISFSSALYSHLCLPETKGLSTDAIQVLFTKKKNIRFNEI